MMKSTISAIALTAVLGFSGAAMAQSTIGGTAIPDSEIEAVTEQCNALSAGTGSTASTDSATTSFNSAQSSGGNQEAQPGAVTNADPESPSIDLNSLTREDCDEAGLGGSAGVSSSSTSTGGAAVGTSSSTSTSTSGTNPGTNGATSVNSAQSSGGNQEAQPGDVNIADPENTSNNATGAAQ